MSKEMEFESSVTALGEDKCPRPQAPAQPSLGLLCPQTGHLHPRGPVVAL